jgi:hypothetical protein
MRSLPSTGLSSVLQHQHVLRRQVLQLRLDARDLVREALVDDEEPRARLVQHARERVAAEPVFTPKRVCPT